MGKRRKHRNQISPQPQSVQRQSAPEQTPPSPAPDQQDTSGAHPSRQLHPFCKIILIIIALAGFIYCAVKVGRVYQDSRDILANAKNIEASKALVSEEFYQAPTILHWTDDSGTEHHFRCYRVKYSGPYSTNHDNWYTDAAHFWFIYEAHAKINVGFDNYATAGEQLTYYPYLSDPDHDLYTVKSFQLVKIGEMVYEKECSFTEITDSLDYDDPAAVQNYLDLYTVETIISGIETSPLYDDEQVITLPNDDPAIYHKPEPSTPPCGCVDCCCSVCTCVKD